MNNTQSIHQNNKVKVALLGATGLVGQVFIHLLSQHPFFELAVITGSDSREGKRYGDEVNWNLPFPLAENAKDLQLESPDLQQLKKVLTQRNIHIVFSALPADVAKTVEPALRDFGCYIFSNASAMRYDENVPILIPEVNPDALQLIEKQGYPQKGFVVTNANCSTTGLVVALAPLKQFGIQEVFVSTYQSISGAGYPGVPALDIMGDLIPFIRQEEEKMIIEFKKIMELEAAVFPHCIRVPVPFGHLETVWITCNATVTPETIIKAWQEYTQQELVGPTFSRFPVQYIEQESFPRPSMSFWGTPPGSQVFTGRVRQVNGKIGFSLLVNNLVKGAAGGSIQNAELFINQYQINKG